MQDEDAGDRDSKDLDARNGDDANLDQDLFGDYRVVGSSVRIVLDGRPVSLTS